MAAHLESGSPVPHGRGEQNEDEAVVSLADARAAVSFAAEELKKAFAAARDTRAKR